jgi:hypothetical protein
MPETCRFGIRRRTAWPHSSEAKRKDPICFSPRLYRPCNLAERFLKNSDASRREDAGPYLKLEFVNCERSEAIHLSTCGDMDCFVAPAPRHDGRMLRLKQLRVQAPPLRAIAAFAMISTFG